ncbi:hypothetical protein ES705_11274 [subsurface metagenome]
MSLYDYQKSKEIAVCEHSEIGEKIKLFGDPDFMFFYGSPIPAPSLF